MSYRCNNCLYIYPSKRSNCPFCGGRIFENNISDEELIRDGFTQAPSPTSINEEIPAINEITNDFHASNNRNHYEELQASYNSEHLANNSNKHTLNRNEIPSNNQSSFSKASGSSSPSSEGGYFAQFTSDSYHSPEVETTPTPPTISPATSSTAPTYRDEAYEQEMQRLETQQRRLQRDYHRLAVRNFISNIRWRTVFRIIGVLGIIILAIVIWSMRYTIIESITNFLISLIPIVIIIAILWYLIKGLFK